MDGSFAFFLLICTLFGIAGGLQGRSKGSSFVLWFFISACLPLFGFLASVVYPGHRHEQRRQCDGCGRLLPITDTMCMGCGTDLAFPEVRFQSVAGTVLAVGRDGEVLGEVERAPRASGDGAAATGPGAGPGRPGADGEEDGEASPYETAEQGTPGAAAAGDGTSPYEAAENPYEQAAGAPGHDAPAPAGSGAGRDG